MLGEVPSGLVPRADEVGVGRFLLHSVDSQEQEKSAIPSTEGAVFNAMFTNFGDCHSISTIIDCKTNLIWKWSLPEEETLHFREVYLTPDT